MTYSKNIYLCLSYRENRVVDMQPKWWRTMLFATSAGRILTEDDLDLLSPQEIETEGVHLIRDWEEWS